VLIHAEPLRRLVRATFRAAGCSDPEAGRIARYLVEANLTGHDSHGVIRVPRYLNLLREGSVVADQEIAVLADSPAMAVVDGRLGFGQTVGPQAVQLGLDKAAKFGVAVIALRFSGHLGRIGDWAEMAAAAGQVSVHFVNAAGSLLVAPFGGVDRRLSTNPFVVGMPMPDGPPLILDFATSVVAEGKVLVAHSGGKPLPPGSLIDHDGTLSNDPRVLYGDVDPTGTVDIQSGIGAMRAMGEHKGSGLSFMCELLAGALSGNDCTGPAKRPLTNGMLSIYMVKNFFDTDQRIAAEIRRYVDFFKSSTPAEPGGEVLVPGEPEQRSRAARLAEGVPLSDVAWRSILDAARGAGLTQAAIDAAIA
jgi:uncharacterized oxidoreductase